MAERRKKASMSNRIGMIVILVVVAVLISVMLMQSRGLKKKITAYQASNQILEEQIRVEEDRAEDLKALPEYVNSDEFVEKTAREKFGLVYEDEIIYQADDGK